MYAGIQLKQWCSQFASNEGSVQTTDYRPTYSRLYSNVKNLYKMMHRYRYFPTNGLTKKIVENIFMREAIKFKKSQEYAPLNYTNRT